MEITVVRWAGMELTVVWWAGHGDNSGAVGGAWR